MLVGGGQPESTAKPDKALLLLLRLTRSELSLLARLSRAAQQACSEGNVRGVICGCVKNAIKPVPGFLTSEREKTDARFNPFLPREEPSIWGFRDSAQVREFLAFGP